VPRLKQIFGTFLHSLLSWTKLVCAFFFDYSLPCFVFFRLCISQTKLLIRWSSQCPFWPRLLMQHEAGTICSKLFESKFLVGGCAYQLCMLFHRCFKTVCSQPLFSLGLCIFFWASASPCAACYLLQLHNSSVSVITFTEPSKILCAHLLNVATPYPKETPVTATIQ